MPPGLHRRGNKWYVRKRVPDKIRSIIGKNEIWKSLGSGDYESVREDFWAISAEIEEQFARTRRSLESTEPKPLSSIMARRFAHSWFREEISDRCEQLRNTIGEIDHAGLLTELDQDEARFVSAADEETMPSLQQKADAILIKNGFPVLDAGSSAGIKSSSSKRANVDKTSDGYWELVQLVRRGEIESIRQQRDVLEGEPSGRCYDSVFAPASNLPTPNGLSTKSSLTLADAINRYLELDTTRSKRTVLDLKAAYRPLLEVVGDQLPIAEITRKHFYEVFDLLKRLPTNAAKGKARQNKTLSELAREAEVAEERTLHPTTINKYMARISALMQWAEDDGLIEKNWARGKYLRASMAGVESGEYAKDPFSMEQLAVIFSADKFRHPNPNAPSFYWAPLLSLFHGMRMEEILQLTVSDVMTEDEVEYFRLHDDGDNHLKNANARRKVPIHPDMWEFGFRSLIDASRQRSDGRLFPDVPRGSEGKFSDIFSKRYSPYLEKIGAKTPKTSFHSYRHNFRDAGRNCQVPDDRVCAIGGWKYGSGTQAIYGSGINIKEKAKAIRNIGYPDLNFDSIKVIDWSA